MGESDIRSSIKQVAEELLVRHGYRGMGYAEIATRLGITRANVHYHFGSKAALIDEVLADYTAATLAALESSWTTDGGLAVKLSRMLAFSRQRYDRFNAPGEPTRPWSLISRLRQDQALLSDAGRARLAQFSGELRAMFATALARSAAAGELRGDAGAVTTLLVAIADSAAPITIAEGGFTGLEAAYDALAALALESPAPRSRPARK